MRLFKKIVLILGYAALLSGCAGSNTMASVPDPDTMTQQDMQAQNQAKLEAATRY